MHITKTFKSHQAFNQSDEGKQLASDLFDSMLEFVSMYGLDSEVSKEIVVNAALYIDKLIRRACNGEELDLDAYGNDASYWHGEYSKLFDAKEFIESELQKECNYLKHSNIQLEESVARLEEKYKNLESIYESSVAAVPQLSGIEWPKLPDGTFIVPGTAIKVVNTGARKVIQSIVLESDYMYAVDEDDRSYLEIEMDVPDPETESSILKEIAPNLTNDQIREYIDRLHKVDKHEYSESID